MYRECYYEYRMVRQKIVRAALTVLILLAISTLLLTIAGLTYVAGYTHALPHTALGNTEISGWSDMEVVAYLNALSSQKIQLNIKDRVYPYTIAELGVAIDAQTAVTRIFWYRDLPLLHKVLVYIDAIRTPQTYTVPLVFTPRFSEQFDGKAYTLSRTEDRIILDESTQRFTNEPLEERYEVNSASFRQEVIAYIQDPDHVYEPTLVALPSSKAPEILDLNTKLQTILSSPLTLTIEDGTATHNVPVDSGILSQAVRIRWDETKSDITFDVDAETVNRSVMPLISRIPLPSDMRIRPIDIQKTMSEALYRLFRGIESSSMVIAASPGPNSTGSEAVSFIEVDISQQRIYLFSGGSVSAWYRVSTGKYLPTPTGRFTILNKARSGAYSSIWNVYMPFWMAFHFDQAYYGIHELPYYYSPDGTKIQRPREFIGSPNTGGCVALDIGDAEKVFDFASVGMPVYIYQ